VKFKSTALRLFCEEVCAANGGRLSIFSKDQDKKDLHLTGLYYVEVKPGLMLSQERELCETYLS